MYVTSTEIFLGLSLEKWKAIGAIGSFAAVFMALFIAVLGEKIRNYALKPKLIFASLKPMPQIQNSTSPSGTLETSRYSMYRILVKNVGKSSAYEIRAYVTYANGELPLPIPLNWTHIDKDTRDISQGEPAYLDVIKQNGSNLNFYGWRDKLIDLEEYKLSNDKTTDIKIAFFERNRALQSVDLHLNPLKKELSIKHNL